MRIHRIALRNYRGVAEAEVCLPHTGVTIIEGNNEIGKTSLVEAVQRLFKYRDDSADAAIRSLQPAGTDARPEVTVEISTGPYRFTYAKRWHRKHGATTLSLSEPARQHLQGRDAHERVQQILAETMDVALWDALRLEQGAGSSAAAFGQARSLSQALDLAVGGDADNQQDDALWDRIVAERDRFWYATGKPRAEGVELRRQLDEAEAEQAQLEAALAGLEQQAEDAVELEAAALELAEQRDQTQTSLSDLSERSARVAELQREAQRLTAQRDAAAAEERRLVEVQDRRRELIAAAGASAEAAKRAALELADAAPRQLNAHQRHEEAVAALERARAELADAENTHRLAVDDRDDCRQQIEVAQLSERRDRVVEAQADIARADELLASLQITDASVAAIEVAHLEQARAAAAADASAASVTALAQAPVEVQIDGRRIALDAGHREQLAVMGSVEISVPGVITIEVRAGAEATTRAARLDAAETALAQRCEEAGVADLVEARAAAAARREAEASRLRATEVFGRDLRDLTFAALAQKVERLTRRVDAYETSRPSEPAAPAGLTEAQAHERAAGVNLQAAQAAAGRLAEHARSCEQALHRAQVAGSALAKELELVQVTDARNQQLLTDARAEQPDDLVREAALAATRARVDADTSLAEHQRALQQADARAVERALAEARRTHDRIESARSSNEARLHSLRGALEAQGEQGRSHDLDQAITRQQRLQREVATWDGRANAARRLHQTFEARRCQSRERYEAPLRARIQELGRVVFGPTLEIELGTDFAVTSRTLHGTTLSYHQLSTGAKEQFAVLSRLACATIVSPSGGVPVVFDDVLGWTDPQRLAALGAAITEAGRSCQVIILTCTPGRFATVADATTIRLGPPGEEAAVAGPGRGHATRLSTRSPRRPARGRGSDNGAPTLFAAADGTEEEPDTADLEHHRSAG